MLNIEITKKTVEMLVSLGGIEALDGLLIEAMHHATVSNNEG